MGVLFVMKTWGGRNERWMQRMLEAAGDDLAAVAACKFKAPTAGAGVPVVNIPWQPTRLQRWTHLLGRAGDPAAAKLQSLVADDSVDTVLVHFADLAVRFAEVWKTSEKPLLVHCHGYDVTWDLRSHATPDERKHSDRYPAQVAALSQRAVFVANSKTTARRLFEAGVPEDRVVVKYLGVSLPAPIERPEHGPLRILYLGRLIDCKGPDLVVQAFERACKQGLDGHLTLAGDGPLRQACELLRARSPYQERIHLLGTVPYEAGDRLREEADVFTAHNCVGPLTRQEEAFGVTIIEAMAAGLPVITGRTSALTETVVHEQTGILVEPGDVESHAAAFLRLAGDRQLGRRMGEAGRARVADCFSIERETAQLRELLGLAACPAVSAAAHGSA